MATDPRGRRASPYEFGQGLRRLANFPGQAMDAGRAVLGAAQEVVPSRLRPIAAGFHGLDADIDESRPVPLPPRPGPPRGLVNATTLDPARSVYTDPTAVETLRDAAPAAAAPAPPPPRPVAGHLQRGQMVMSGGMRSFPNKGEYSEAYLRSLNPESFADLMGRRKLTADVQTAEAGARGPEELARVAGAQQDLVDYDTATRAPGRQAGLLRLKQLEFDHPVSRQMREDAERQTYLRYGYPQEVSGRYALERQGLVNEGLDARTRLEQEGLDRRDQAETGRVRLRTEADTRGAALRALGSMETKRMDPYASTPYSSPYEADFFEAAFPAPGGEAAAGAPVVADSPEQIADTIRRMYPQAGRMDYRRIVGWLEQNGHLTDVTPDDRQRILTALQAQ